MEFRKDKEYLGDLEKNLYKKDEKFVYERQKLTPHDIKAPKDWQEDNTRKRRGITLQSGIFLKLFFLSVAFFVLAAGIAFYRLIIAPTISPQNVEIVVQAPASVGGGEETSIQIIITNKNTTDIESATLKVLFPEGARHASFPDEDNYRHESSLGPVPKGKSVTETLPVILFGEENTEKVFDITLEYRVGGSSALFSKYKIFPLALTTAPVSLLLTLPAEANAGEEISIKARITSNLTTPLNDLIFAIEYPFGFTFTGATPSPSSDTDTWFLGDVTSSGVKNIEIRGKLEGQTSEQKTFKIKVGKRASAGSNTLGVIYNSLSKTVPVTEPFIGINFVVNNNAGSTEVVAQSGGQISGSIDWINNLPARIQNGEIILKINGELVDRKTVNPNKGFFRSLDDSIIWNQTTDRTLTVIEPGQSGSARFSFNTISLFTSVGAQFKNPKIVLSIEFTGERVSPGFPNEPIKLTSGKTIKLVSAVQLASLGAHFVGPFKNTGPMPPRVDKETTYTVTWAITNSSNTIKNATVRASIPIYVRFLGITDPESASVRFNELTGEIVWDIGDVAPGVGITRPASQIDFQVGLTPSISQLNTSPAIISSAEFSGVDTFTNTSIETTDEQITTRFLQDSEIQEFHTRVVP